MKVLKFGGTSVGSADSIRNAVEIIRSQNEPVVAVFSALSGITNKLVDCLELASGNRNEYLALLDEIEERHITIAARLLKADRAMNVAEKINELKSSLIDILKGISKIGEVTSRSSDMVLSFGEHLSIQLIYAVMSENIPDVLCIDSRDLIFTRLIGGMERLEPGMTEKAITEKLNHAKGVVIMSGFIARSVNGYLTTLGRGGSDYTASIIAAAVNANILEIWTDVSGIYTADPTFVQDALPIKELSYMEALELSHFGAKVIYPPSLQPVMKKKIPMLIRNSFARSEKGTLITHNTPDNGSIIKAVSSIDQVCLVSLSGSGMAGIVGIASRMFSSLANNNINVILITQASSEQSICIAIEQKLGEKACEVLNFEFEFEIQTGRVRPAILEKGYSIVAMVGEHMKHSVGISGQAFSALGRNGINIHAIAQGSSELNISAVVKSIDCQKAVTAIHQEFFQSVSRVINLFIVGTGKVGTELVKQIHSQYDFFISEYQTDLRIVGLANSRRMIIRKEGIKEPEWKDIMMAGEWRANIEEFIDEMFALNLSNTIFIDNTASETVSMTYGKVLSRSISIVTCNKIAASSSYNNYHIMKKIAVEKRVHFRFESNVGAGLPVIQTIGNMVKTGDQLVRIEAVLSGSLNFIFDSFCGGMKFSDAVMKAMSEGYTEPDPLIDLRGVDVARKLLILVREAGIKLEVSDIAFNCYLPHPLPESFDAASFPDQIREYDIYFESVREGIVARNERLRVIAKFKNEKAGIFLQGVNSSHPFFNIEGNDNVVSIFSKRYLERPLIIKGAGAGAEVTASGIFADVLSIINN